MRYRYTKYTGDLLDDLDLEDLVAKLSDLLLASGFGNPYAMDDEERTMQALHDAILDALFNGGGLPGDTIERLLGEPADARRDDRRAEALRVRRHAESRRRGDAAQRGSARTRGEMGSGVVFSFSTSDPGEYSGTGNDSRPLPLPHQRQLSRPHGRPGRISELVCDRSDARLQPQHDFVRRGSLHARQTRRARARAAHQDPVPRRRAEGRAVPRFGRRDSARRARPRAGRSLLHEYARRAAPVAAHSRPSE